LKDWIFWFLLPYAYGSLSICPPIDKRRQLVLLFRASSTETKKNIAGQQLSLLQENWVTESVMWGSERSSLKEFAA
jgi:hypothetical protein